MLEGAELGDLEALVVKMRQAGVEIARGAGVWDGILDSGAPGACTAQFQIHSTSRRVAGGPFEQSLFKCRLIPVSQAIGRGFYGVWAPDAAQQAALAASELRKSAILEASLDCLITIDATGRIVDTDAPPCAGTGFVRGQVRTDDLRATHIGDIIGQHFAAV